MRIFFEIIRAIIFIFSVAFFDTESSILKIIMLILNLLVLALTVTVLRIKSDESGYINQRVYYGSLFGSIFGIIIYAYLIFNN